MDVVHDMHVIHVTWVDAEESFQGGAPRMQTNLNTRKKFRGVLLKHANCALTSQCEHVLFRSCHFPVDWVESLRCITDTPALFTYGGSLQYCVLFE